MSLPLERKRKRGAKKSTRPALVRQSFETSHSLAQIEESSSASESDESNIPKNSKTVEKISRQCPFCHGPMGKKKHYYCLNKCNSKNSNY